MAGREISFELARFEWVTPERLEVEGSWNGVRRLVRATLVVEVDGKTRRLRALPGEGGSPEEWSAAFAWDGGEMPKLEGAELEVGRSIVVDLPRPRTSKARGAAKPQQPIPATTRAEKQAEPAADARPTELELVRAEAAGAAAERDALRAELESFRAEAGSEQESVRAELEPLRAQAEEAAAERDSLRTELDALRAQAEQAAAERDALRAELETLRAQSDEAASEGDSLRSLVKSLRDRAEDAEAQRDALCAQADEAVDLRAELESIRAAKPAVSPDVARLRAELEAVERERSELRAQLDATQPMPPPAQDTARRFDRRPAERTAKRSADPEPTASLADKVTGWVGTVIGTQDDEQGAKNGDAATRTRPNAADGAGPAKTAEAPQPAVRAQTLARTRSGRHPRESPSWPLRVAAIGLLALLLLALLLIVTSVA